MDRSLENKIMTYLEDNTVEDFFEKLDVDILDVIEILIEEGLIDPDNLEELVT